MNKIGTLQRDRLEIDQVEVGLHSLRDEPPIEESDRFGIGAGQAPDQLSDVETIVGIPSPMREQETGEAGIGDKADMRAAVAEPEQGIGIADPRAARGKIVVEIIDDRREQQRAPLLLEEKVRSEAQPTELQSLIRT